MDGWMSGGQSRVMPITGEPEQDSCFGHSLRAIRFLHINLMNWQNVWPDTDRLQLFDDGRVWVGGMRIDCNRHHNRHQKLHFSSVTAPLVGRWMMNYYCRKSTFQLGWFHCYCNGWAEWFVWQSEWQKCGDDDGRVLSWKLYGILGMQPTEDQKNWITLFHRLI